VKELVIISGKGGTGKTSITGAFASLATDIVLCDADVDAADLHLILNPAVSVTEDFTAGHEAIIRKDKCSQCGQCIELCRFGAVKENFEIDPLDCEGCGVCVDLCPEQAIDFPETICGQWYISDTRFGSMVHARLGIAQENSGKLISLIRGEAKKLAEKKNLELILTDGPPGTGCPVIASVSQATAVLVITEPTVSGIHDLERVRNLTEHFNIPTMVCINKYDLCRDQTQKIEEIAGTAALPVVGRIAFDPIFTQAMIQAKTIFEYNPQSQTCTEVKQVWDRILKEPCLNQAVNNNIKPFIKL
jgi:MinD superfamily P-loop ATPase